MIHIPYGYCHCGCGERTNLAKYTHSRDGQVKDQPYRYLLGHAGNKPTWLRFREGVDRRGADECWPWKGSVSKGYGVIRWYEARVAKTTGAHRYSYAQSNGPIPDGHHIHHRCGNPLCVNPAHLEALSPGGHVHVHAAAKEACPNGHPYTPENTYIRREGWRMCRVCNREAQHRYAPKRRVAAK